ncbi:MAG: VWA domain-containing protein, partial [Chloroflexi bacterium]
MITFLTPFALLFALLAVPILLLYMLKLRRKEVVVSSSLLWQMLLRDRQANAPWQKLKRNLLLFLQLLILVLLVLSLGRPALPVPVVASGSVILILDASASMNAEDVSPSRFEAARTAAQGLIENLDPGSQMTLIQAGARPTVLAAATGDKTVLRNVLDQAAPTKGEADWQAAFALAGGAVSAQGTDADAAVVILSDGGLPEGLPPLPGEVRYVPIGNSGDNLALDALAVRPSGSGAELFALISNYGSNDREAVLSLYADEELIQSELIRIPAGGSENVIVSNLPDRQVNYRAHLINPVEENQPLDVFRLDDTAFAAYHPPASRRVLLLTDSVGGNVFLEQVLASLPGISPYRSLPDEEGSIRIPEDPFDVYVFDGVLPEEMPSGDYLLINPPPDNPLFEVGGTFTDTAEIQVADHPLARFVDMRDVQVMEASRVETPPWADVLVSAEGGPLVFAGETGGRRVAAITFDLRNSDLPLRVAFPILFANLIDYLAPALAFDAPEGLQPGEPLHILPDPAVQEVALVSPEGAVTAFEPGEDGILFTGTGELGLYAVNYLTSESQWAEYFAVNLFNP